MRFTENDLRYVVAPSELNGCAGQVVAGEHDAGTAELLGELQRFGDTATG